MRVCYNPIVGILMVVLGAVCEFLGVWLVLLGEFNPAAVVGLVPMLLGILYLVRPYFWVTSTTVEVVATIGPVRRTFPFRTLEVDGGRLIAVSDGGRKKVPVTRWMAHSGDWAAAVERATRR